MNDLNRINNKEMKELSLVVPIPPSVNKIYFNKRSGGRGLTAHSERYIKEVRALVRAFVDEQAWTFDKDATWYYLDMVFYFPDKRIRDTHNCLKILMDALEGVCFHNDYFVLPRIHSAELDRDNPRLEMWLGKQDESERQKYLLKTSHVLS